MLQSNSLTLEELKFLLYTMNWRSTRASGDILYYCYPRVADKIVNGNWMITDGVCDEYDICPAEEPLPVEWIDEKNCYCYFSVLYADWVPAPMHIISYYRLNFPKFLAWLQVLFHIDATTPTVLLEQMSWHTGVCTLDGNRLNVYYMRCLDKTDKLAFEEILAQHRGRVPAVILAPSALHLERLGALPSGMVGMTIENVLVQGQGECKLDEPMLLTLIKQLQAEYAAAEPKTTLRFSADYRQVEWRNCGYSLTKKQAAVLEALVREGGRAHKDLLCAEAETNQALSHVFRNRFDGQFGTHPLWDTLIRNEGNGYYVLNNEEFES